MQTLRFIRLGNGGNGELYIENEEIVQEVRFTAIVDRKTTEFCISLDGQVFPLKEAPLHPLHLKCRSSIQPLFRNIKYEGKRIAVLDSGARKIYHRDGSTSTVYSKRRVQHIPESMTHSQWVQSLVKSSDTRDVTFAREMLGKTRFDLVKAGKFKVEKLYYHGKLKTIAQLKELL